jgi:hypothetical protein
MLVDSTPVAFTNAVHILLNTPELLAAKLRAARETSGAFGIESTADAFLDLNERIDATTRGRLPLSEAVAAFRSTRPAMVGKQMTLAVASVFKRGFRAWVRLHSRTIATGRL